MRTIWTELHPDPSALEQAIPTGPHAAFVMLALGFDVSALAGLAARLSSRGPVFVADCYGVLGFDRAMGRNRELLEQGRGREYGGVGGDGGRGVVAIAFSGEFAPSTQRLSTDATSHLLIAESRADIDALTSQGAAPYYGGRAKATYRFDPAARRIEQVPFFVVSSLPSEGSAVGLTSFTADAPAALRRLLQELPAGHAPGSVGLFPCFMRGKNEYGRNDVEPDAVSALLPGVHVFGMFCHGELGPKRCLGFDPGALDPSTCTEHSMTSIVAIHTARANG